MSKRKSNSPKGIPFDEATPELIAKIRGVINEQDRHRYSVSRVYAAYNKTFNKQDKGESCSDCLKLRANALRKWLADFDASTPESTANGANTDDTDPGKVDVPGGQLKVNITPNYDDPANPAFVPPAEGVTRIPLDDGSIVDFTPNEGAAFADGAKGIVVHADGEKVKPGTYTAEYGKTSVSVQPGGKATYRVIEDLT